MSSIDITFKPLYTSKKRYFFLTGGRGSTKTYNLHEFVTKLTYERGHGVLFTRYTMTSAEKSIIPEFRQTLERLGVEADFHVTKTTATNLKTGSFIFFSGIKTSSGDQTGKLKSLPNITTWVIEEGEDFNDSETFDKIDDSIRQKNKQNRVIWVMNPTTSEHFIYERWVEGFETAVEIDGEQVLIGNHPEVENIHSTYLLATKYLSDSFLRKAWKWRERSKKGYCPIEERQISEIEREYARKWYKNNYLGGWLNQAEGAIYTNWRIGEFNEELPYQYGLDFGSNDPDALTKVAVDLDQRKIYIKEIYFSNNTSTAKLMRILYELVGTEDLIVGDSAQRRQIRDYYDGMYGDDGKFYPGVNIHRIKKTRENEVKFKTRQIKTLQGFELIISPESTNVIKAVKNYRWHDSRAGVPNHDWSDLCDSWGYAAIDYIDAMNG